MIDDIKLREKFNPDGSELRNAQVRMFEILQCVDDICRKHNLPYWLASGTLLGAVRHGGFIPWDDDVDIEMMKKDYDKLMTILPQELPEQYVLQNYKTDHHYVYLYAKVRDTHSQIIEGSEVNQSFKYQGLFIDIFPVDDTNPKLSKISSVLYNRLCFVLGGKGYFKWVRFNSWLLNNLVFPIFNFVTKFMHNKRLHFIYGISFLKERRKREDIFPLSQVLFEGRSFSAPHNTDAYLQKLYGDYMTIPQNKEVHIVDGKIKIW